MPARKDDCAKAVPEQVHSSKSHGVDGLETQQNGFAKGNQSAVRLTFQKGNAQELQMSLNVLFKTQEIQKAFFGVWYNSIPDLYLVTVEARMQIFFYNPDDFDSFQTAISENRIIGAMAIFFQPLYCEIIEDYEYSLTHHRHLLQVTSTVA
ncbi:hypothetical protein J1605_005531 [Eschrichtius robustus]|uniref:Uncharacterized protein n=1 Tax=Eschrichtius robustus TaxID=9764 RepID=A0AB34H9X3_ESCRO|nr:hypothetical protein J1605_005531 [Eschrichtius robustus]